MAEGESECRLCFVSLRLPLRQGLGLGLGLIG